MESPHSRGTFSHVIAFLSVSENPFQSTRTRVWTMDIETDSKQRSDSTNTALGRFLPLFRHSPPSLRHSLLLLLPHIVILLPLSEADLHVLRLDLLLIRLRDGVLHGVPGVSVPSNSVSRLRFTEQSNPTINRLSHFPLCAFLRLMLTLLTAARLHVEFSGRISPHSLKSKRNTLLVEGLCVK